MIYVVRRYPPPLGGALLTGLNAPDDTSENILFTYTRIWTPNRIIRWMLECTCVNNANAKNIRVRLNGIAGTVYYQRNLASSTGITIQGTISNRGVTNSQCGSVIAGTTHTGTVLAWGKTTSAIDTSVPVSLVITVEKATAGDLVTLERVLVEELQ